MPKKPKKKPAPPIWWTEGLPEYRAGLHSVELIFDPPMECSQEISRKYFYNLGDGTRIELKPFRD